MTISDTGTERLQITTAGNVGIGSNSPSVNLEVLSGGTFTGAINVGDSGSGRRLILEQTDVLTYTIGGTGTGSVTRFVSAGSSGVGTERMRIDASGNLLVGTTSAFTNGSSNSGGSGALHIARDNERCLFLKRASSNGSVVEFFRGSISSAVGSISITASATAFNTSSDLRLKSNIADAAEDAGELIDAIQVRSFDWKADGEHQRFGMVAQELKAVAPEAVSAPEDPDEMMGVDYSKLVPMLVKEIQSLRARVAQLETEEAA